MADAIKVIFLVRSALFPIVGPLGGSPIFLLLAKEYPSETRRALSWRIALNTFLLTVVRPGSWAWICPPTPLSRDRGT